MKGRRSKRLLNSNFNNNHTEKNCEVNYNFGKEAAMKKLTGDDSVNFFNIQYLYQTGTCFTQHNFFGGNFISHVLFFLAGAFLQGMIFHVFFCTCSIFYGWDFLSHHPASLLLTFLFLVFSLRFS